MSTPAPESHAWGAAYADPALAARRQRTYAAKLKRLGLLEPVPGRTLDVACGHGDALAVLGRHGHTRLVGIDLNLPGDRQFDGAQVVADGAALPFADAAFERVTCLHSLHHFRSFDLLERMFQEARRVMTDTGRLYLLDHWGSAGLRALFRLLEWRCPLFPARLRAFGQQLREEHEAIFWWLREWRRLHAVLAATGLRVVAQQRTPAFLYLTCRSLG